MNKLKEIELDNIDRESLGYYNGYEDAINGIITELGKDNNECTDWVYRYLKGLLE